MVINKNTSNQVMVSSLIVLTDNRKPIKNIVSFDTETQIATLSVGGPVTAADFAFTVTTEEEFRTLIDLFEVEYPPTVEDLGGGNIVSTPQPNDPRFRVSYKKAFQGKKGMVDSDLLPDNVLTLNSAATPGMVVCSNCGSCFLLYVGRNNSVWSATRVKAGDKFDTLTEVDLDTLTCDNCEEAVSIYDPM